MTEFLNTHKNWIIDGNGNSLFFDERMKMADKIIFMNEGIIAEQGTPEQIFTNPQNPRTKEFITSFQEQVEA